MNCFRLKTFKTSLFNLFKTEHAQSLTVGRIREFVNEENRGEEFSDAELFAAIDKMQDDNQIMLSESIVFLIWGRCNQTTVDFLLPMGLFHIKQTVFVKTLWWLKLLYGVYWLQIQPTFSDNVCFMIGHLIACVVG